MGMVRSFTLRRLLFTLAALVVLIYGGAMVWLVSQETRLVFRAANELGGRRPSMPFEQVDQVPPGRRRALVHPRLGHAGGGERR